MSDNDSPRILIVGGVAGGASAAARARRLSEDAEIVLFERGLHISFANCGMPYHIGGQIADRDRLLVQTPDKMWTRYRIDVRLQNEVTGIDTAAQTVTVRNVETDETTTEHYDELILSPGAEPVRPRIPGIDAEGVFTLRNLSDMDRIKTLIDEAQPAQAVIVGGGYIGLEMAEALRGRGVGVTLVEMANQVFGAADPEMVAPVHRELRAEGVDLLLGTSVTSISREDGALQVLLSTGGTVSCGLVIMAVGVKPEVGLAREAGLEIGKSGGIVVDDHMRTSAPARLRRRGRRRGPPPGRRPARRHPAGRPGQPPGPHRRRQRPRPRQRLPRHPGHRHLQGLRPHRRHDGPEREGAAPERRALPEGLRPPSQPRRLLPRRQPVQPQAPVRPEGRPHPRRPGRRRATPWTSASTSSRPPCARA